MCCQLFRKWVIVKIKTAVMAVKWSNTQLFFNYREMCTWDLVDGQCIESVKLHQIHSHIQVNLSFKKIEMVSIVTFLNAASPILLEELKMHLCFVLEIIQRSSLWILSL